MAALFCWLHVHPAIWTIRMQSEIRWPPLQSPGWRQCLGGNIDRWNATFNGDSGK
jgi:hypothetical protein